MGVQATTWEHHLLARANEAFSSPLIHYRLKTDDATLDNAYEYCSEITSTSSHTFYLAANLLPKDKRRAVHALYAFCRTTDDLVDKSDSSSTAFSNWRHQLANPTAPDQVALAWTDTLTSYSIPHGYVEQLVDGIARDLVQNRYSTFAELTEYCYGVASTVGLIVMHIIGFQDGNALPYAIKLGVALQLTNILRDVGEDWRAGRFYLPLDELAKFGLTETDIATGRVTDGWRAFMRFQLERTRALYHEAAPGIALLDSKGRFAIAAASTLYRAILDDIEAHDYDVFQRRAHVGLWGKLKRLPGIWWNSQQQTGER